MRKTTQNKIHYQVFISSTYKDLVEERKEVMQAVLSLRSIPVGMEVFPAAASDATTLIKKLIDESDYYILILAGRYGSVNKDGISYTEIEYDYAIKKRVPVIAFIVEDLGSISKDKSDLDPVLQKKLAAFREKVQRQLCKFYKTPSHLASVVTISLTELIRDKPRAGLIRVPTKDKQLLNNLTNLINESRQKDDIILTFEDEILKLRLKSKYYDIFPHLNNLFSLVHSSLRRPDESFDAQIRTLVDVCTSLKQIFDLISVSHCHVCVKMYILPNGENGILEPMIGTIARDTLSFERSDIDSRDDIVHLPSQNTDFEYLVENIKSEKGKAFFCNDLIGYKDYKNTSFIPYTGTEFFYAKTQSEREKNWPLKYKSTIVVPICPSTYNERKVGNLAGFLCVDAPVKDAFNKDMDPEILRGCADGLFNLLSNIKSKKI